MDEHQIRDEAARDARCDVHREAVKELRVAVQGPEGLIAKMNRLQGAVSTTNRLLLVIGGALIAGIVGIYIQAGDTERKEQVAQAPSKPAPVASDPSLAKVEP